MFPPHVVAEWRAVACQPAYMGRLPPVLYQPGCTGLTHAKSHYYIGVHWKLRHPPRFYWFSPNFGSPNLCTQASYQKMVKVNSGHFIRSISVLPLMTPLRGRRGDIPKRLKSCWNRSWVEGGGGGLLWHPLSGQLGLEGGDVSKHV